MSKSDPFGFDMSIKSAKKKNPRGRRGMSGASETSTRVCDHEGCEEAGKFRAPKAPDVLDDFFWFCQEHVREYNNRWNFFDGKTEAEMNAQESSDKVWERRTKDWRDPEAKAWARLGIEDPHQVLGQNATQNPGRQGGGTKAGAPWPQAMRVKLISEGGFSASAVMNQPLGQTWWDYLTLNELKGSVKISDDTTEELLRRHREAQQEATD